MNKIIINYILKNFIKTFLIIVSVFYCFGIILNLFEEIEFLKNDKRNQKRNYFAEIYDNTFFHYRASTWYMIKNYNMHNEQIKSLIYLI